MFFDLEAKCTRQSIEFRNAGNLQYQKGKLYNALQHYNESLCFAERSLELALAYANRSAVYFELKLYRDCLDNIESALLNDYPQEKVDKLLERKEKCENILQEISDFQPNQRAKDFFKLSYSPNQKIPFIINGLELKSDAVMGRGIYATRDLRAGDIIAIEEPVMKVMYDGGRYEHCCNCMKAKNLNLKPCKRTASLMFCSVICRMFVYSLDESGNLDAILRFIQADFLNPARYEFEFGKLQISQAECKVARRKKENTTIFDVNLCSKSEAKNKKNLVRCLFGLKSLKEYENEVEIEDYYEGVMKRNGIGMNYSTLRSDGSPTGLSHAAAVCLFGSYFNNSCDANVKRIPFDNELVFYVAKPVRKGEQLFITYCSNFHDTERNERQEDLKRYEFECKCVACEKNFPKMDKYDAEADFIATTKLTAETAIDEFRKNNEIIENEFESYPNAKLCFLIRRNLDLMSLISSIAMLPLHV